MIQRYFTEPYRFVPPYRGQLWCRVAQRIVPRHLARNLHVPRWQIHGIERLRESVRAGAGIVLAANHSRWADPLVLGVLGVEAGLFCYYLVSYHLFKQSRPMGWWINRIGGYSVWREGADREAIRATAHVLATADRPVVMFPEGTWFRQNDRLGPLQEGLTLMLRQAAKQSERPLRVHPVAIKYWYLDDPRPALRARLDQLEARIGWRPQGELELVPRIEKLGAALLALKEIEHIGQPQAGPLDARIERLADAIVGGIEKFHLGRPTEGLVLERIRRLRLRLTRRLLEVRDDAAEVGRIRQTLDELLFCENLAAHSLEYLRERPSVERLAETVQRIEETVHDVPEQSVGRLGAVAEIGPALDGRAYVDEADALIPDLASALQGQLDRLLAQGMPSAWNGSPPAAPQPSTEKVSRA